MPRLSDSMEEGTILKWLKSSGEQVALGEPIAEIETDKATMTYEADAAGFLGSGRRRGRHAADRGRDREAACEDASAACTPHNRGSGACCSDRGHRVGQR